MLNSNTFVKGQARTCTRICPAGQKAPSVALSKDGQVGQKDDTCSEKGAMTFSPHKSGHGERFKQRMGTAHAAGDSIEMKRERFNKNQFFDCLRFFRHFHFFLADESEEG